RCLLAIDRRQFIGQIPAPQFDLLIGVVKAAHLPRLQRLGDLPDVVSLRASERQRHIPLPLQQGAWVRAAVRPLHDYRVSHRSPLKTPPSTLSVTAQESID